VPLPLKIDPVDDDDRVLVADIGRHHLADVDAPGVTDAAARGVALAEREGGSSSG
jgi:hypothetical protein